MKIKCAIGVILAICTTEMVSYAGHDIHAQVSGNVVYSNNNRRQRGPELPLGNISMDDSSMLIEANVLMNVKADQHVAIFSTAQEARTLEECNQKLDVQINRFMDALKKIGITETPDVDFIAQNRIYDYEVTTDVATEKLSGFEVKKNISVPYKDKGILDKLLAAAARANIYDLVKVDYLLRDVTAIRQKLLEEASRTVKEKADRYGKLLGIKFRSQVQVYMEKYNTVFPTDNYDSYAAYETGNVVASPYDQRFKVKQARKGTTFFFNPKDAGDFDEVINPVVTEPVVQFSLYLRVKHFIDR
ncbi:MAG TPA: SIMPL domain-containing protein [Blastocatellia bacterium]|nr:SIMPL domain-containing protein [Blastocatellia bacterium]